VTADNLSLYLMLVADYRLNREIASSCAAFLGGLSVLIDQAWLRMFNDRELQQLISGSATGGIDMAEMRQHVKLEGGYHDQHPVLQMLWEVLEGFDNIQRASFLKFVTGCSRCAFGHPLCAAAEAGHECIGCLNLAPIKDLCLWMEVIASCRWHHCRDIEKLSRLARMCVTICNLNLRFVMNTTHNRMVLLQSAAWASLNGTIPQHSFGL
jgi:hypothetical protein